MPCDIEKAKKDTDEKPVMRMKGIASGLARDSDGEFLEPEGFDLDFFLSGGMVNWHHQAKVDPLANIGEPEIAKIVPEGLYVECMLYDDSKLANSVYELGQLLEKNSKTRRLGFSIEGKVLERDPLDETRITKAKITGLAITHIPKNPATLCEIMKGERDGFDMEWEDSDDFDIDDEGMVKGGPGSGSHGNEDEEENNFFVSSNKETNISTAKKILKDLGVVADFSSYSDTDAGHSVYFKDDNDQTYRISDHGISNKERMSKEITLYFDQKTMGIGGKRGIKSNKAVNKFTIDSLNKEEDTEKAIDTVTGAALRTESLDGDPKKKGTTGLVDTTGMEKYLSKGEVFEKIFSDFPDIALSKSKQVYRIIEKTSENMNNGNKNQITDSAIEKAYNILGLGEEIQKGEAPTAGGNGGGRVENPRTRGGQTTYYKENGDGEYQLMNKGEAEDGSDDTPADDKTYIKKGEEYVVKDQGDGAAELGTGAEQSAEKGEGDELNKGTEEDISKVAASLIPDKSLELLKGFLDTFEKGNQDSFRAVGTILKGMVANQLDMQEQIKELSALPASGRKSIENVAQIDRFAKGQENEIGGNGTKTISASRQRGQVIQVLNGLTFNKGEMDQYYAGALTTYEASGNLNASVRQAIENVTKIKIVD